MLEQVIENLGLDETYSSLKKKVPQRSVTLLRWTSACKMAMIPLCW